MNLQESLQYTKIERMQKRARGISAKPNYVLVEDNRRMADQISEQLKMIVAIRTESNKVAEQRDHYYMLLQELMKAKEQNEQS